MCTMGGGRSKGPKIIFCTFFQQGQLTIVTERTMMRAVFPPPQEISRHEQRKTL